MCAWFISLAIATYAGSDEAYYKRRGEPAQQAEAPIGRAAIGCRRGPVSLSWEHQSTLETGRDRGHELLILELEISG